MKGRRPSSVSNWIAEGKISRDALIGDGVRARIWVERADADLLRNLDPAQQAGQDQPVTTSPPAGGDDAPSTQPRGPASSSVDDEDIRRRRRADADKAEHDAEMARRRLAVDEGRWMEVAEARRVWNQQLAKIIGETETFLFTTLARDLAERHGLDWKRVSVEIREMFHKHRAEVAEGSQRERVVLEQADVDAEA